ncbi:MAG: hypothetical protein ACLRWF_12120, partial [Ruthenibacterium sp.]
LLVYRRGTRIEIESPVEMVSNMDGNCVRANRETYAVMPGALRFILPENIGGEGASCCRRRCINVKLMTNYIDFGESARHF